MKKLMIVLLTAALITPANAKYVPKAIPFNPGHAGPSTAVTITGLSIIGVAAFLSGYDLMRRWTCLGDPLRLGGPGFSEPMPLYQNVKAPPVCR